MSKKRRKLKVKRVETWEDSFYKKILCKNYDKKDIKRQFYLLAFDHPFDFAIPRLKLLIEIDGDKWHKTKKAQKRDVEIDAVAKNAGWKLQRYHDEDLQKMGVIKNRQQRIGWDQYWINICFDVAKRSTCLRRQLGAVIVKENVIVATGFNGAPTGLPHCTEIGCLRDKLNITSGTRLETCRGVHAEINSLLQAGKAARGGTLYVTCWPCIMCAKAIINSGIMQVVISGKYSNEDGINLLKSGNIKVVFIK